MSTDLKPHAGFRGQLCECTKHRRSKARRGCSLRCDCHELVHARCPRAMPCLGGCGRLTTSTETVEPGFCVHCATDAVFRLCPEECAIVLAAGC